MGAPPKSRSSHGRANPAGSPYLYLGSLPETAAAEIRPHTGEVACVADFTIPEIKAVDLRNPRKLVSPFILSEASAIGQLPADLPFLERLGDEQIGRAHVCTPVTNAHLVGRLLLETQQQSYMLMV